MTTRERLIELLTDIPSGDHRGTLAFSAKVENCRRGHVDEETKSRAIEAWNRRVSDAQE